MQHALRARLSQVQDSDLHFYIAGYLPHATCHDIIDRDNFIRIDINSCPSSVADCNYSASTKAWSSGGEVVEFDITLHDTTHFELGRPTTWDVASGCT